MNLSDHVAVIEISTKRLEEIAAFGITLSQFTQAHPTMNFTWGEAVYADGVAQDNEGAVLVADNVEIFDADPRRAVFLVHFCSAIDLDTYKVFRARTSDEPPAATCGAASDAVH